MSEKQKAKTTVSTEAARSKNRGQTRIRPRSGRGGRRPHRQQREIDRKVVSLRRVTKVRKGAKRLRFSAFVVVGDRKGRVGIGLGRALDTRLAVEKASKKAEKEMIRVPLRKGTIPHEITHKLKSARVMIKPAGPGTGIIAGSSVRAVMELCGVHNVLTKALGTTDPIENAKCTYAALKLLKTKPITRRLSYSGKDKTEGGKKQDKKKTTKKVAKAKKTK